MITYTRREMPPRFLTCQLCGQQFGSASIGIHTPQCQAKMLGRWQNLDPKTRGPPPVLRQQVQGGTSGGVVRGSSLGPGATKRGGAFEPTPGGAGGGIRSGKAQPSIPPEYIDDNGGGGPQLSRCRKCGRGFAFDRVAYHESVCKGNAPSRPRFNSSKMRQEAINAGDGGGGFGGGGGGAFPALKPFRKPTGGRSMGSVPTAKSARGGYTTMVSSSPPNKTSWRAQHNEFINMIRDAKKYAPPPSNSRPQPPPQRAPRQPFQDSVARNIVTIRQQAGVGASSGRSASNYGTSNSRYGAGSAAGARQQQLGLQAPGSLASGGGTYGQQQGYRPPSSGPGPRVFGSTTGRWEGRGPAAARSGGGGGGISIANSNETSLGMRQAFGRY